MVYLPTYLTLLPSSKDYLGDNYRTREEHYRNGSVLYCVPQLWVTDYKYTALLNIIKQQSGIWL